MSIAEPMPLAKKLQPLQKWYLLFPENWAELALDREWRRKRLKQVRSDQTTRGYAFWIIAGLTVLLLLLTALGGFAGSWTKNGPESFVSRMTMVVLLVNNLCILLFQALSYVKSEVERILLQLIDHLETEDADHV